MFQYYSFIGDSALNQSVIIIQTLTSNCIRKSITSSNYYYNIKNQFSILIIFLTNKKV